MSDEAKTVFQLIEMVECKNFDCKKMIPKYMDYCSDDCEKFHLGTDLSTLMVPEAQPVKSQGDHIVFLDFSGSDLVGKDVVEERLSLSKKPFYLHSVKINRSARELVVIYTTLSEGHLKKEPELIEEESDEIEISDEDLEKIFGSELDKIR